LVAVVVAVPLRTTTVALVGQRLSMLVVAGLFLLLGVWVVIMGTKTLRAGLELWVLLPVMVAWALSEKARETMVRRGLMVRLRLPI
jgi:hypothetical protein